MNTLGALLKPRSVAVIGASADPTKTSGRPVAYLRKHGYAGDVYPVNPRMHRIDGLPGYPDIQSLPQAPDVGLVLLGPEGAIGAVRQLAERGTAAAIILASGFAEVGEVGAARQRALLEAAGGMRLLGPNTIGLVNLSDRIVLSASSALEIEDLATGAIAVVSQSGGILGSLLSRGAARGIGFSKLISTGNEADLDLSDFVAYLADDPETKVIALYMEGIRNITKFRAAVARARAVNKPIVVYKIGRSSSGAAAAASHTGALAGTDVIYDALFQQAGVARAQSFSDLLDLSVTFATARRMRGDRVAILTSTGGAGSLVTDSLGVAGLEIPPPDPKTAQRLKALQPGTAAALDRNPIDVTLAGLQPDLLRGALRALLASPTYDAVVVVAGSSVLTHPTLLADAVKECLPESDKLILAYMSPHAPDAIRLLTEYGVPALSAPESCASVLASLLRYTGGHPQEDGILPNSSIDMNDIAMGPMDERQAKRLFARFGIPITREIVGHDIATAEQAARKIGNTVVLKILSAKILHKSDVGGVAVGIPLEGVGEALREMSRCVVERSGAPPEAFLVQEMVTDGIEVLVGLRRDALGMVILLGMGGVAAELFKDTALRVLAPGLTLSRMMAREMVQELKMYPLLSGYRGRPHADVDALIDALVAFSHMGCQMGDRLETAEINPLFVLPRGQGVKAADGIAMIRENAVMTQEKRLAEPASAGIQAPTSTLIVCERVSEKPACPRSPAAF